MTRAPSPVWPRSSTTPTDDGDIVRRGDFGKSLDSGTPIPLIWMHKADDPRCYVGDVVEATETDDGLAIKAV
jgi:hypothetical protein